MVSSSSDSTLHPLWHGSGCHHNRHINPLCINITAPVSVSEAHPHCMGSPGSSALCRNYSRAMAQESDGHLAGRVEWEAGDDQGTEDMCGLILISIWIMPSKVDGNTQLRISFLIYGHSRSWAHNNRSWLTNWGGILTNVVQGEWCLLLTVLRHSVSLKDEIHGGWKSFAEVIYVSRRKTDGFFFLIVLYWQWFILLCFWVPLQSVIPRMDFQILDDVTKANLCQNQSYFYAGHCKLWHNFHATWPSIDYVNSDPKLLLLIHCDVLYTFEYL